MAKEFHKVTISYKDENEMGKIVTKKDSVLIEAISLTEIEKVTYQLFLDEINPVRLPEMRKKSNYENDFRIKGTKSETVEDIIYGEGDSKNYNACKWNRANVVLDYGEGKESVYFYISGDDVVIAGQRLKEELAKNYKACDCTIRSIIDTRILGVFSYDEEVLERANKTYEKIQEEIKEKDEEIKS